MDSSTEGTNQTGGRFVMQEMANIQRCTARLEDVLQELLHWDPVKEVILKEIRNSAERASLLLDASGWDKMTAPKPEGDPKANVSSPFSLDQMISGVSTRKKLSHSGDGRRRSFRKRSHVSAGIRVEKSKNLEDGHQWRKYGQKNILDSNYPRSYFRCTHKRDQGCKALRKVQRSESDPSTFIITYVDEHTCRDPALAPHFISPPNSRDSCIINFEGNTDKENNQITNPSLKTENDAELSNLTTGSSSSNHNVLHEADATPAAILPLIMPPSPADADSLLAFPAISVPVDLLFITENNFELDVLEDLFFSTYV